MAANLLTLFISITGIFSSYSQTRQKATYSLDKKYYQSRNMVYVPTGSYKDSSGKTVSVHAFFITNEITNKEYREFTNYVTSHPDSSLHYFERKKDGSFFKQQLPFSQIRLFLIDSQAMARNYPSGTELFNKYKNYFTDKKYDDFPVIGVSQAAARYYCVWKTDQENKTLKNKGMALINDFRIPTKEELEYARSFSPNSSRKDDLELTPSGQL